MSLYLYIFAIIKPDYVMKFISIHGTNKPQLDCPMERVHVKDGEKVTKNFHYPELASNHIKYGHIVDNHNDKCHPPI